MNTVHNHISINYDILHLLLKIYISDILKNILIANKKKSRDLFLLSAHMGVATWVAQVAVSTLEINLTTLVPSGKFTTG